MNEVTLGQLIVESIPVCLCEFPPDALFIKWKSSTFWVLEEQPTLSIWAYVSSFWVYQCYKHSNLTQKCSQNKSALLDNIRLSFYKGISVNHKNKDWCVFIHTCMHIPTQIFLYIEKYKSHRITWYLTMMILSNKIQKLASNKNVVFAKALFSGFRQF